MQSFPNEINPNLVACIGTKGIDTASFKDSKGEAYSDVKGPDGKVTAVVTPVLMFKDGSLTKINNKAEYAAAEKALTNGPATYLENNPSLLDPNAPLKVMIVAGKGGTNEHFILTYDPKQKAPQGLTLQAGFDGEGKTITDPKNLEKAFQNAVPPTGVRGMGAGVILNKEGTGCFQDRKLS